MPANRKFSRIDWGGFGESFKASCRVGFGNDLDDIREGTNEIDYESDDQKDEEVARRSLSCFVMTLLVTTAAAVIGFIGFHPNSAINFNWGAMRGNMLGSLAGTVRQQQTREQILFEIAKNVTVACDDETTLLRATTEMDNPCRTLCDGHMCCFEEEEEKSCASDPLKACPSYAGCIALINSTLSEELLGG